MTIAPPPKSYSKYRWAGPVTTDEAVGVIDRYNAWVDLRNRNELNSLQPINPNSECGGYLIDWPWHRSLLCWKLSPGMLSCAIRLKGWEKWQPGPLWGPYLRTPADPTKIVWAGWLEIQSWEASR